MIAHPAIPYSAVLNEPLSAIGPRTMANERRVSHEGMVSVGGNLYSAPDATRRRVLEVQKHPSEVRIFEGEGLPATGSRAGPNALIAAHAVLEGKNQRRVDPAHRKAPPPAALDAPPWTGVSVRPLSFYDAVARRLAGGGVAP